MSEKSFSISFDELCEIEGIESQLIVEIVEYEIVTPLNKRLEETTEHQWLFDTASIYWIQKHCACIMTWKSTGLLSRC